MKYWTCVLSYVITELGVIEWNHLETSEINRCCYRSAQVFPSLNERKKREQAGTFHLLALPLQRSESLPFGPKTVVFRFKRYKKKWFVLDLPCISFSARRWWWTNYIHTNARLLKTIVQKPSENDTMIERTYVNENVVTRHNLFSVCSNRGEKVNM